jgi:hypothetical protein
VIKLSKIVKKLQLVSILAMVLGLTFTQFPITHCTEWSAPEEALIFLENVVELDLTKYTQKLDVYDICYPVHLNGLDQENVVYTLEADGNSIQAAFAFVNKTLHHCGMFILEGEPIYIDPKSKEVVNLAKETLQNFQAYSKASKIGDNRNYDEMNGLLDTIKDVDNAETSSGEMKLKVTKNTDIDYVAFEWMSTLDNVDFNGITLEFLNGTFCGLGDNWRIYKIGSTTVNVSEEEATKIALNTLENFSWNATQDGERVEVTDFQIVKETLTAELITTRNKEPLTLYPSWSIVVYLDKIYPGNVNRFSIGIWADTGEVISCTPLSMGGLMTSEETTSNSQQLPINNAAPSQGILAATTVATILGVITATAVIIKKKRK